MKELLEALDRMNKVNVLVLGDIMLDRYTYGTVERISAEAPAPVLLVSGQVDALGGAANVAANLRALGAQCALVGVVGEDDIWPIITQKLGEAGVRNGLVVEKGRKSTLKQRFVVGSHQLLRVDREHIAPLSPSSIKTLVATAQEVLPSAQSLVLSDYGKGILTPSLLTKIIQAAAGKAHILVDPRGNDYRIYRGADVVMPNLSELRQATRMPLNSDEEIVNAAASVVENAKVGAVLVKRGKDGMTLVNGKDPAWHLRAHKRDVYDVTGAGDTAVATVAAGLAIGLPLWQAATLANIAAGIVVSKVGTAVARQEEIRAWLHEKGDEKVATQWPRAREVVDRWRRAGLRIGFTNGCFDLLHAGHLSLLTQAHTHCDRLVVGLNTDSSIRMIKGADRPIQNERHRAALLATLNIVDLVVPFEAPTPEDLIKLLRPDVLIKGAEYEGTEVVGSKLVESWGGKLVLADMLPGCSTSNTIASMRKEATAPR